METQNRKLLQIYAGGSETQHEPITTVQNDTSSTPPLSKIQSSLDSSMALAFLVLLTALFFMAFFSNVIRRFANDSMAEISTSPPRRRSRERESHGPPSASVLNSRKGLDQQTVRSLPVQRFGGGAKYPIEDCAICLSGFEEGETVKVIPHCQHVFHVPCVDAWLSSHVSCPVCRNTRLFADEGSGGGCGGSCGMQGTSDQGTSEVNRTRSRVENGDTCIDVRDPGIAGVRRISSCSSLGQRTGLHRTSSF